MTVQTQHVPRERADGRPRRQARAVAWVLALTWVAMALTAVLAGERTTSYGHLVAGVVDGEVREVELVGGLPEGSRGYATTEAHWRGGLLGYRAEVVEAGSRRELREHGERSSHALVGTTVAEQLTSQQPGLRVTRGEWGGDGLNGSFYGWHVPSWLVLAVLAHVMVTWGLVLHAPAPRRATRAAWGWLVVVAAPVGVPAYLLLSGVTSGSAPTRDEWRLTGGWAFLLACWLAAALNPGSG